ncbi:TetR/AcrR family transcriptional regulator [Neptunomonas japonica]|uniref:TetR/AcrR family transcriptional regulator n=1 Tax=Neptunomonas japonica TaxID=417574 RepID=UPI00040C61B9|nr:TetR/AcrR family transcriptional regulator [Neptunomonas japonica]
MRYKPDQKAETRKKIIIESERSFKKAGYSGIGVDGLAKAAGVTSGAFYGHFKSKEAAFKEAINSGMGGLFTAISELKQDAGEGWWAEFATFYTHQKRTCDLTESCALQSLSPEVGRSNDEIRAIFEAELLKVFELANSNEQDAKKTWASLAMLIGGVTLARAVKDDALADQISKAVENEVIGLHENS